MRSASRLLVFVGALLFTSRLTRPQIVPGQLPEGPPAQPGQVAPPANKTATTTTPASNDTKPSTFTPGQSESPSFTTEIRTVLVPTTVLDPDGHGYVNGLQASDFEVIDNDKPQRVTAEMVEQPMSVVLAVQANADTAPVLPELRRAGLLLHGLVTGADGDVAVISFDHKIHQLLDFSSNPDKIDDALQKLQEGSSVAALIDAVTEADHMLQRHDPTNKRRRVIVLLSRNVDTGSTMKLNEAITQIQFHNIIVYAVNISKFVTTMMKKEGYPRSPNGNIPPEGLPPLPGGNVRTDTTAIQQGLGTNALNVIPPVFRGVRDLFKKTPAESLSSLTGGNVYNFGTERGLEAAMTDIGKDLNSQYTLSYEPTKETQSEPGFHTIKVVVDRPQLIVRARVGYWWGGGQMQ